VAAARVAGAEDKNGGWTIRVHGDSNISLGSPPPAGRAGIGLSSREISNISLSKRKRNNLQTWVHLNGTIDIHSREAHYFFPEGHMKSHPRWMTHSF